MATLKQVKKGKRFKYLTSLREKQIRMVIHSKLQFPVLHINEFVLELPTDVPYGYMMERAKLSMDWQGRERSEDPDSTVNSILKKNSSGRENTANGLLRTIITSRFLTQHSVWICQKDLENNFILKFPHDYCIILYLCWGIYRRNLASLGTLCLRRPSFLIDNKGVRCHFSCSYLLEKNLSGHIYGQSG